MRNCLFAQLDFVNGGFRNYRKIGGKKEEKLREKNLGSVTVETCLAVPLFLFFMLAMADLYMLFMAEAHIHQSLAEAAGYTAQYAYLEDRLRTHGTDQGTDKNQADFEKPDPKGDLQKEENALNVLVNSAILIKKFREYLGDDIYVEKMIAGGKNGILLTIKMDTDNPKIFLAKAGYRGVFDVPLLGSMSIPLSNQIKQKAFLGYSREEREMDSYVYVTPEQSVYHMRRSCTHLSLSVHSAASSQKRNHVPCSFCGKEPNTSGKIYLTRTTNVYHNNAACSGLKRSVRRVKKSEVKGLNPCSRCGSQ